jgi:predicted anti-sigma-YlaC factor YlaD
MDHETACIALMGYLDGELAEDRSRALEDHLAGCDACRQELEQFRSLKEVIDPMRIKEPTDLMWEEYWGGLYNRMERGIGWILISISSIVLISFALIHWVQAILEAEDLAWYLRGSIFLLVIGFVVLLVSAARERLYLHRKERYKEVQR